MNVQCKLCGKSPEEISEYKNLAKNNNYSSATQACISEEGTYNSATGKFYCTSCYIALGMPSGIAE